MNMIVHLDQIIKKSERDITTLVLRIFFNKKWNSYFHETIIKSSKIIKLNIIKQ